MDKQKEHNEEKEKKLKDAYFKRYGVYYPKNIAKKLADSVVFSLRELYNIIKGRTDE